MGDQLTLSQLGETDYAHHITTGTPGFSDLPKALYQLSVLVHTERLILFLFYLVFLYEQKQATDQLLICNHFMMVKRHKPYVTK